MTLARKEGVADHEVQTLRQSGVLVSVGRGVDRLRDHPFDWSARLQAALDLAGPEAVVGRRSAARLHRFYDYRNTESVEVLVPRGLDHRLSIGRLVQTRDLPPSHVTMVDGFAVTNVARTFFDLCGSPDPNLRGGVRSGAHHRLMQRVVNDGLARRGLAFVDEVAVLGALGRRGRRGTTLVRALLMKYGPDYVPTRSNTESLFMELVEQWGLPDPTRQAPMSDAEGFIGVVDFAWLPARLVVEVDSSWHDGPLDREVDSVRDDRLSAAGYTVLRYRYSDLVGDQARIRRVLEAAVWK